MLNVFYFVPFTHIISSDEVENCHESYMWKDSAKACVVHSENDNPVPVPKTNDAWWIRI